jgi:hypothetical protein
MVQTNSLIFASLEAFLVLCLNAVFPLGYDGASRLIGSPLFEGREDEELDSGCSFETSGMDNAMTRFIAQINGILRSIPDIFQN